MLAGAPEESEALTYEFGCRAVYYGTEASTHPNNPCKGATVRKCAELDTQIIQNNAEFCTVITKYKDIKGEVFHEASQSVQGTPSQIIDNMVFNLPLNAEMVEINR